MNNFVVYEGFFGQNGANQCPTDDRRVHITARYFFFFLFLIDFNFLAIIL